MHTNAGSNTHHDCNKVVITEGGSSIPHSVTLLEGSCSNTVTYGSAYAIEYAHTFKRYKLTCQHPQLYTAGHETIKSNLAISCKVPHHGPLSLCTQVVAKCAQGCV